MAIDIQQNNHFTTKETALAAYLYMEGFELLDVDTSDFPSVFIFPGNGEISRYARLYQVGKAEGNLVLFYEAYRKMLQMAKAGKW